jgi:uridylate kinase
MGMLATTINALAIKDTFEQEGIDAVVLSAVKMDTFADFYTSRDAIASLEAGKVVILGGGTGLPYFSTDTAAALRAAEIEADVVLMAKNIDAIYSADPKLDPTATRYA